MIESIGLDEQLQGILHCVAQMKRESFTIVVQSMFGGILESTITLSLYQTGHGTITGYSQSVISSMFKDNYLSTGWKLTLVNTSLLNGLYSTFIAKNMRKGVNILQDTFKDFLFAG